MSMILNPYRYAAASSFSPLDVSGCQTWLDGADASTLYDATSGGSLVADDGQIARWEDKSGNSNHVTQATTADRPYRRATEINGNDAIDFGDDTSFLHFDTLLTGASTETIFVALRYDSGTGKLFQGILSTGRMMMLARQGSGVWGTYPNGASGTTLSVSTGYVLTMIEDDGNQRGSFFTNGSDDGSYTASGSQTAGIGGEGTSQAFGGFINEIIIYDSALSTADRESVENYLGDKWGVTITH